eukprot:scaffold193860_cov19-Tisochrysis_lutea.AAC.1
MREQEEGACERRGKASINLSCSCIAPPNVFPGHQNRCVARCVRPFVVVENVDHHHYHHCHDSQQEIPSTNIGERDDTH